MAAGTAATTVIKILAMGEIPKAAEHLKEISSEVVKSVDSVLENLEETYEEDDKMHYDDFGKARTILKEFSKYSISYADAVNDVFFFSTKIDRKNLQEAINSDNYGPLNELLHSMNYYISHAKEAFTELEKASQKAKGTCARMAKACLKHARESRKKETVTKIFGGTASTALIAGGVGTGIALSVMAGLMTFGMGTVVGLSLTAAGAGIAGIGLGTATAVTTHRIAGFLDEAEKSFEENANKLDEFYEKAVSLDVKVETELEMISKTAKDVRHHLIIKHKDSLKSAVDLLLEKLDKSYTSAMEQKE